MTNQHSLRPMFSYSFLPILFLIFLIGVLLFIIFYRKTEPKPAPVIIKPPVKNLFEIKARYHHELNNLEQEINNQTISNRKAYQKLSKIIRNFIFEVTQIKVQNYSLQEIIKVNIPSLTALVEEYYHPEFAKESNATIKSSLEKTRGVIESWR